MTIIFEKEFSLSTTRRIEFIDITSKVNYFVKESRIGNGVCYVYVPHTTAAVTINENADHLVVSDIIKKLNSLIPKEESYKHLEGNSDAHIKSTLTGNSLVVFVSNNNLKLGNWQGIYFCEYDGPRVREVWLKILGEIYA